MEIEESMNMNTKRRRKMKILLIQDTDWFKRNPHQQHHLAERLSLKGHEIRVIDYEILWRTEGKKELFSKRQVFHNVSKIFKDVDITVIRPGILKIPILDYISMLFTYNQEIKRQIMEFMPDVIVCQSILTNYLAMRLAKRNNIPFIFHLLEAQYTMIPFKPIQPIGKIIESKILKNADKVVTINEKLRDYAIRMGAKPEDTYVVRAGIDLERYDPNIDGGEMREIYGIEKDDSVLFFMGWLYHFSGLKEVTVELSKIKNEKPNIKLLIVGDGDAFNALQKIREENHLNDQIILTGKKPYQEIPAFIAASDICLLPAYPTEKIMQDIVPIKMYEYMAMGKPVITTKLPGVMKEFGEDHGVIYVDKPEDVLKKGIELIENGMLKEYGSKARGFVESYGWDDVVDEFEGILADALRWQI
jgi:glycosyltransferase involved in cell wall biosynthesis